MVGIDHGVRYSSCTISRLFSDHSASVLGKGFGTTRIRMFSRVYACSDGANCSMKT